MEARLQVEKDNRELRKKANLVRAKLQRFYFLMRLLPLSRSPDDYAAFARKYKEERVNANWREQRKVEKGVGQESGSANIEELDENAKNCNILLKTEDNNNIEHVMSNSFGFGGTNATLVFSKYHA